MATKRWRVIFFKDAQGHCPAEEYILEGNDPKKIAILLNVLESLAELGPLINATKMGDNIEGPIHELIKNRHRILYGRDGDTFVLLLGFFKGSQKTPPAIITGARAMFAEYLQKKQFKLLTKPSWK